MRHHFMGAAAGLAAALALSACASNGNLDVDLAKGSGVSFTALAATAQTLDTFVSAGRLKGHKAHQVRVIVDEVRASLNAADDARLQGQTATAQQDVEIATTLFATLTLLASNPDAAIPAGLPTFPVPSAAQPAAAASQ